MMKTILLVEDDSFISDVYAIRFRKEGFHFDIARDGQTAVEKIKSSHPNVILLDIDLPKMNGVEVLNMLRSDPGTQDIKVIIFSNYRDEDINKKYGVRVAELGVIKNFLKIETTPEEVVSYIKKIIV